MTTLEKIREEIDTRFKQAGIENTRFYYDVLEIIDKYAEKEPCDDAVSRILKRMWNCRGKHTTSIDKVKMEQIIREELLSVTQKHIECDDAVSRQAVDDYIVKLLDGYLYDEERTRLENLCAYLWELPSVRPQEPTGHCKDCKYFEYDSVAKVDGVPLIVAHEICSKWGDGCKTKEDGYCFLFEPRESEVSE